MPPTKIRSTSTSAAHEVDSTRAWIVVASAFLAMFTVFGVAYSFGEFFGPMADEFGTSRSATALFFSITTFAYFAIGIISGRIADRIGPRRVMVFGAVAMVSGLLLTAEVSSIRLGYFTYGLGVGIGVACCYVPMVAAVGGWFEQRRTFALGLAVAGIGTGTLVLVPIIERLIEANGWRDAYRVLAAALFTPFVFMADYIDTTEASGSAAVLLGLIGMASIIGRLGLGALAGRVGIVGLYRLSSLGLGLSFLIWIVADANYALLIAFAIVLGVSYGGIIALSPAVVAQLFGTIGMGGVLGALYTANGLGGLIGPPTMGQIIDSSGHTAAQWAALASGLLGTALLYRLKPQAG
jgi:MFS family permease